MTTRRLPLFAAIAGLLLAPLAPAHATLVQQEGLAAAACGAITYTAATWVPLAVDVHGTPCPGPTTIADGGDATLGAKADPKSTATDTTPVTIMQVLKEISALEQAPATRAVTNAGTFAVQSTNQAQTDTVVIGGVNVKEINAVTPLMGAGATGTGSQRVTAAQDTTTIAGSAPGTAGTASANVVSVQGIAAMTPLKVNGSGTAGSPNAGVASVQGISGGTALPVIGSSAPGAASFTRPNDTNAYAALDVLGSATGSTAALSFTFTGLASSAAQEVMITSSALEIGLSAVPSGMTSFELALYSCTPPSALGDNVAYTVPSGDRSCYLGKISLGSPAAYTSSLEVETDFINRSITAPSGGVVYGYLITDGAYTPAANTTFKVTLHAMGF